MPDNTIEGQRQAYEAIRQQEVSNSGIASPNGPTWAQQQAAQAQQIALQKAAAAKVTAAEKARAANQPILPPKKVKVS